VIVVTSPAEVRAARGERREEDEGAVAPTTAAGAPPRLLDQCLDQRLELAAVDEAARARRIGRSRNAHALAPDTVKLL
jgi:hypothetical protein